MKVLVVDDSALMRRLLGDVLRGQADIEVAFARDGVEAMAQLHAFRPDVVTLDIHMPQMDGLACLNRIMLERPTRVLMLSALTADGANETLEAMELGAIDFFAKPSGAISLAFDTLAPALVAKIRAVAQARLRSSLRLAERVRLRTARARPPALSLSPWRPAPGERAPQERSPDDCIVLIGCSTGGPPALDTVLAPLPADFPWPVVVAQHMPAAFTGSLARRLDALCALDVLEVTRPEPLLAGRVYVGQGDADVLLSQRQAGMTVLPAPSSAEHRWHPSVDRLVTTAMTHLAAARLVGVLMTGMGDDGARAMTRLRAAGGRTIAEAESTAVVWGMPGELVKAGGAQIVAPLDDIARHLLEWAH